MSSCLKDTRNGQSPRLEKKAEKKVDQVLGADPEMTALRLDLYTRLGKARRCIPLLAK